MKKLVLLAALICACGLSSEANALTKVRVAWCSKTLNIAVAPFAVATKMGWFKEGGIEVEVVPFGGSTEFIQNLVTGEVDFSHSTAEPLAAVRSRGVKGKVFYTVLHKNIFGLAVPADSPIHSIADLKGKTVGVTSMASAGVLIARAIAATNGLDPDRDFTLAAIGEAGQSAALIRSKQVDALSQFASQYALVEYAGIKLRKLDNSAIADFPSNGLAALDSTLNLKRKEAVALARGFAMGTLFADENTEAATRIMFEVYPESRPMGRDEATSIAMDKLVVDSLKFSQDVPALGVRQWGLSDVNAYENYLKFLKKWAVIKDDVPAADFVTNELIDDINKFDSAAVLKAATSYGSKQSDR
jgi:NitT/TauT family transport system substrate-binding protein